VLPNPTDNERADIKKSAGIMKTAIKKVKGIEEVPDLENNADPEKEASKDRRDELSGISFVSLNPCACPCPPAAMQRLLGFLTRPTKSPSEKIKRVLIILLLAIVPTASILVLFVIPSTYGRLGFIVGESLLLAVLLKPRGSKPNGEPSKNEILDKADTLTYMLG
jgi:hypothetical protein